MSSLDTDFLKVRYLELSIDIESHNYMANFWNNTYIYIGIPSTILSSIVTASVLSDLSTTDLLVGFISLTVTALSAVSTFLNPSEKYLNHKTTKSTLVTLRNNTVMFISLLKENQEVDKQDWESYQVTIGQVYAAKPQVPEWVKNIAIKRVNKLQKIQALIQLN